MIKFRLEHIKDYLEKEIIQKESAILLIKGNLSDDDLWDLTKTIEKHFDKKRKKES